MWWTLLNLFRWVIKGQRQVHTVPFSHKVRKTKTLQKHCFGTLQHSLQEPSVWDAAWGCWEISPLLQRGNQHASYSLISSSGFVARITPGRAAYMHALSKLMHASNWPWAIGQGMVLCSVADSKKRRKRSWGAEVKVKDASLCLNLLHPRLKGSPPPLHLTPRVSMNHFSRAVWGILECCLPDASLVQTARWGVFYVKTRSHQILTQLREGPSILNSTLQEVGKKIWLLFRCHLILKLCLFGGFCHVKWRQPILSMH